MKSRETIEKTIREKLNHTFDPPRRGQLLARALHEQEQSHDMESALDELAIRRMIMKNSLVKLGIAAIVIVALGMGIKEFLGAGGASSTVWAQVVKNVETSTGVIFRVRNPGACDPDDAWPNGYEISWRSPMITRTDKYRGGQLYRTYYFNYDAKTAIALNYNPMNCYKETISDERVQGMRDNKSWTDPQGLLNHCLSVKHHALAPKTIDGVRCEGLEATGPDGSTGRLWISSETSYPVLMEIEATDNGGVSHITTVDQFRWNVDLLVEGVEPEVPADDSK